VFTCLDFYRQEEDLPEEQMEELNMKKETYSRRSRHQRTLVFEIVDLMLKIVDFENDQTFTFRDQNVKQLSYTTEDKFETLFVRLFPLQLVKMLEKFSNSFEVIIYTVLPKRFLDQLRKQMPEMDTCCDFILSLEDCQEGEECLVKDISIFLGNRKREDIFVIDTNGEHVDEDTCISVSPKPWDGTILYT
jgi:hypothetical protein